MEIAYRLKAFVGEKGNLKSYIISLILFSFSFPDNSCTVILHNPHRVEDFCMLMLCISGTKQCQENGGTFDSLSAF